MGVLLHQHTLLNNALYQNEKGFINDKSQVLSIYCLL